MKGEGRKSPVVFSVCSTGQRFDLPPPDAGAIGGLPPVRALAQFARGGPAALGTRVFSTLMPVPYQSGLRIG